MENQSTDRQRVQFFLPTELHEVLRIEAFRQRTSQQKLVVRLLTAFLLPYDRLEALRVRAAEIVPHASRRNP